MLKDVDTKQIAKLMVATSVMTTLIVNPWTNYDPINLPKMLVLVTGAGGLIALLAYHAKTLYSNMKVFFWSVSTFVFMMFATIGLTGNNIGQQFWGTWGRSTGVLTYLCLVVVLISSALISSKESRVFVLRSFERLSYFISFYSLLQVADLDPINWSQKQMVATLGNINFVSSFLGLANIVFIINLMSRYQRVSAKLFYAFMMFLNLYLIFNSQSIQGFAIFATGLVTYLIALIYRQKGRIWAFLFGFFSLLFGLLAFAGTAGFGPLRNVLLQETVIFRMDYWRAGVNMTMSNWLTGVGIDSYGDFYRQYRDLSAVERTGPQRITNTAHNIFLDIFSGGGLFTGLSFVFICVIALISVRKIIVSASFDEISIKYCSLFLGYLAFCMISINQIGVAVWGFLFLGGVISCANSRNGSSVSIASQAFSEHRASKSVPAVPRAKSLNRINPKKPLERKPKAKFAFVGVIASSLVGLLVALPPVRADIDFLVSLKARNLESMRQVVGSLGANGFHRDRYLAGLLETNQTSAALQFAWSEIQRDPRNFYALSVIAFSSEADLEKRRLAASKLKAIDPYNRALIDELESLEKGELAP